MPLSYRSSLYLNGLTDHKNPHVLYRMSKYGLLNVKMVISFKDSLKQLQLLELQAEKWFIEPDPACVLDVAVSFPASSTWTCMFSPALAVLEISNWFTPARSVLPCSPGKITSVLTWEVPTSIHNNQPRVTEQQCWTERRKRKFTVATFVWNRLAVPACWQFISNRTVAINLLNVQVFYFIRESLCVSF